jgi:hypothetical protein
MRFKLELECDNDAFQGAGVEGPFEVVETARLLREAAERLYEGAGSLRDGNGNTVGRFAFEAEPCEVCGPDPIADRPCVACGA